MWMTSGWRWGPLGQPLSRPASRVPVSSSNVGRLRFGGWAPSRKRSSDLPRACPPARPMWPGPPGSLPLDGARGLGGGGVDDAVDALDLVDDPARVLAEQVVAQR